MLEVPPTLVVLMRLELELEMGRQLAQATMSPPTARNEHENGIHHHSHAMSAGSGERLWIFDQTDESPSICSWSLNAPLHEIQNPSHHHPHQHPRHYHCCPLNRPPPPHRRRHHRHHHHHHPIYIQQCKS